MLHRSDKLQILHHDNRQKMRVDTLHLGKKIWKMGSKLYVFDQNGVYPRHIKGGVKNVTFWAFAILP